jgi:hypothetical protein
MQVPVVSCPNSHGHPTCRGLDTPVPCSLAHSLVHLNRLSHTLNFASHGGVSTSQSAGVCSNTAAVLYCAFSTSKIQQGLPQSLSITSYEAAMRVVHILKLDSRSCPLCSSTICAWISSGVPAACAWWRSSAPEACVPCAVLPGWLPARLADVTPAADAGASAAGLCSGSVTCQALQAQVCLTVKMLTGSLLVTK